MAVDRHGKGRSGRLASGGIIALALLLAGCGTGPPPPLRLASGANPPAVLEAYALGPGDRLKITVFGVAELSGEFDIDGNGTIPYPLLGDVPASGRSARRLEREMAAALDRDFIVDPRVTIEVVQFRPFFVLGQVNTPGSYPYVVGLSARQAIAIAGGFTRRAKEATVLLIRRTPDGRETIDRVRPSAPVLPGDTLEVERRLF